MCYCFLNIIYCIIIIVNLRKSMNSLLIPNMNSLLIPLRNFLGSVFIVAVSKSVQPKYS